MKYIVNKEDRTVELLPSTFTADELLQLVDEFKDFSFSVSFSAQKMEKQGMVVGANYISIKGTIEHN